MISVLLIILKIIGIVLLVAISLVVLLLLTVLLVPVRYRFKGSYDDKFLCKGKITWFLHLISVHIVVEEKAKVTVRILGIPMPLSKKKGKEDSDSSAQKETTVSKTKNMKDTPRQADENNGCAQKEDEGISSESVQAQEQVLHEETNDLRIDSGKDSGNDSGVEGTDSGAKEDSSVSDEENGGKKATFFDKLSAKWQDIIQKIKGITEKIKSVFAKIRDIFANIKEKKETLNRYLNILKSDTFKAAFAACKKSLWKMLKHILPRKMRIRITYGMANPADTGYVLAVYGMLPEVVGKKIFLQPDFEQQIFKGDFNIKGAIRMWSLLYQVLRVLTDKNCRRLYHIVKKEIANEHK